MGNCAGVAAAGNWSQRHAVPRRVHSRLGQQSAPGHVRAGRRSDAQTLDPGNLPRLDPEPTLGSWVKWKGAVAAVSFAIPQVGLPVKAGVLLVRTQFGLRYRQNRDLRDFRIYRIGLDVAGMA